MVGRGTWWLATALLAAGFAAGGVGIASRSLGVLGWLEGRTVDARFALRGSQRSPGRVVLVALDTQSYRRLPLPPLPRSLDAQVIDRLTRAGARVIAFDFALERPSSDAQADHVLVDALARARGAVVSVTAVGAGGQTNPLAGRVAFANSGVHAGVTLLPVDGDGAVRRFPAGLGGVESFALASARQAASGTPHQPPAGALIDYPGPAGTVPALSFAAVRLGQFDPRVVRGRVVVIGPTAPVLQDIHSTPVSPVMAGPEIQSDAITTALAGFPLRSASSRTAAMTLLGLGLLVPLVGLAGGGVRRRRSDREARELCAPVPGTAIAIAIGALGALAWSAATQVAFDHGTVLAYTNGLLSLAVGTAAVSSVAVLFDRRERRRLRMLFAAHTPEIVELVLRDPHQQRGLLTPSAVIAGYRLEEEIGQGGMGVVYRASQLHLDRPVALKLIRSEYADSPAYRARFERESRLAAAVSHPNVVPVFDAGEDTGLLYIVMQYIDGIDLSQMLRGFHFLGPAQVALLLTQIGGALDAAHQCGLVHRDVKPANILLSLGQPWHAFLTDFGLAKQVNGSTSPTQAEGWAGTLDYVAPEQLDGRPVDHRADVYALAGIVYHALTGSVPFPREDARATMWAHFNAPRPAPTAVRKDLPPAIDEVIARGMARLPAERYPSAGALAADAAAALGQPTPPAALAFGNHQPSTPKAVADDGPTEVDRPQR